MQTHLHILCSKLLIDDNDFSFFFFWTEHYLQTGHQQRLLGLKTVLRTWENIEIYYIGLARERANVAFQVSLKKLELSWMVKLENIRFLIYQAIAKRNLFCYKTAFTLEKYLCLVKFKDITSIIVTFQ